MIDEKLLPELVSAGIAEAFRNKGLTQTPPRTATVLDVDNTNATATVAMDGEPFGATAVRTLQPVAVGDRVVIDFTAGGGVWVKGVMGGGIWSSFEHYAFFAGLAVGNATLTARYMAHGHDIHMQMNTVIGSTTAIAGQIIIELPVQAATFAEQILLVKCYDTSAGLNYLGVGVIPPAGTGAALYTNVPITQTSPFTWAPGDNLAVSGTYESI